MSRQCAKLAFGIASLWAVPSALGAQDSAASPADIADAAREYFAATYRADAADGRDRKATRQQSLLARQHLETLIASYDESHATPLLADAAALRAAFAQALRRPAHEGAVGTAIMRGADGTRRAELVPADLADDAWHLTVLLLPDASARESEASLTGFLEASWSQAAARERAIVVAPAIDANLDLDDLGTPKSEMQILPRVGAVLKPLGEAWRTLPVDRRRAILDCGRGTSAFGLLLASHFPDRFAGIVLRWPTVDDRVQLQPLAGQPILLVRSKATELACETLRAQLEELAPGSCRIITPPGEYPFANDAGIGEWARQQRSSMFAERVVLAPGGSRFRRNRWISILECTQSKDDPRAPWLDARVDRRSNTITVDTSGVQSFRLSVGPDLVDVREFTLVLNGKRQQVRLQPRMRFLLDQLQFAL